jgi:hypothetical protein
MNQKEHVQHLEPQIKQQENLIRDITCSANRIGPKASMSPMLIKHRPSHLNYSTVLLFHNFILLRYMWGKKLLINTMLKAKLIERDIP